MDREMLWSVLMTIPWWMSGGTPCDLICYVAEGLPPGSVSIVNSSLRFS
ncbi:MAG: hypothetical protein Q4C70_00225 [Planctomycetia bacterium]|nr:hypothetical protein [Planctomycetia bacterium]